MTTQTPTREMFLRPLTFEVSSESKPNVTYRVTLPSCECPDFAYRRTHPSGPEGMFCKHLRAAFASAGWQLPGRDTSRLDEATARELLLDFHVGSGSANAALARSRRHVQGTIELGTGIIVIVYNRAADTYDVQLPG